MAQNFPGAKGVPERSAPYSRPFTGAAVLTTQVDQAQCASSGALLLVSANTPTFAYKDCTGTTITLTTAIAGMVAGQNLWLGDISMTEIVTLTNATLLVYWHGSGART